MYLSTPIHTYFSGNKQPNSAEERNKHAFISWLNEIPDDVKKIEFIYDERTSSTPGARDRSHDALLIRNKADEFELIMAPLLPQITKKVQIILESGEIDMYVESGYNFDVPSFSWLKIVADRFKKNGTLIK